jgi:hypothetical protein
MEVDDLSVLDEDIEEAEMGEIREQEVEGTSYSDAEFKSVVIAELALLRKKLNTLEEENRALRAENALLKKAAPTAKAPVLPSSTTSLDVPASSYAEVAKIHVPRLSFIMRFVHNRENNTLLVDQEAAIDRLLELFPASGPCTTPIHVKFVYDPTLPTTEYQHLEQCGSLSHIARFTRPDIAFAVNLASRFSSSPNPSAESLLLRIRNYLSNSKSLKLKFHGSTEFNLTCFSDSDFASGSDSKSTSACLIKLGLSPIHWSSQRQRSTATSTAEAEYTALSNMCKTTKFIIHLINFLGIPNPTVKSFCDNQAAIAASTAPAPSSKLSIHFIREFVRNFPGINYIPSADNIADILTKALDQTTFDKFISTLLH